MYSTVPGSFGNEVVKQKFLSKREEGLLRGLLVDRMPVSSRVRAINWRVSPGVAFQVRPAMFRLLHILILCLGFQALAGSADAATSTHAVFRSTDRGRTWTRSDAGLPGAARINAMAASPHRHFAGTDAGLFVSDNSGTTWRAGTAIPGPSQRVLDLCLLGRTLYAGTDGGGIVRSDDDGTSWLRVDRGRGPDRVRSLGCPTASTCRMTRAVHGRGPKAACLRSALASRFLWRTRWYWRRRSSTTHDRTEEPNSDGEVAFGGDGTWLNGAACRSRRGRGLIPETLECHGLNLLPQWPRRFHRDSM